jgi:exopolyphosphatase/guanosine-5'-triphosphate,3'-diphosphate pyrophosphatase
MIVGELRHGQMVVLDRIRETVRLAEGLSSSGELSAPARARAIDCLSRFGQRLREVHAANVRAAGTSTLRRAKEESGFLTEAEAALGHPIEVISGREEARLIYKGVVHSLPPNDGLRLVMDIGGGSTELILGEGAEPKRLESLHLGCVSLTERFFPDGRITTAAFEAARRAARLELRPVKSFFRDSRSVEAIGTSGTILATENVATTLGFIDSHTLTGDVLERLIAEVLNFESIADLKLSGLADRRAQVWPGGLAILVELISVLRVEKLGVSDGALREGLLYDLAGRLRHEDARERSVRSMMARFQVDTEQARRVVGTAALLREQCARDWRLQSALNANILEWSAELHEIGLDISHDGYQRHGAYIAEHADMPGFPRAEQRFLAYMIHNQRHQFGKEPARPHHRIAALAAGGRHHDERAALGIEGCDQPIDQIGTHLRHVAQANDRAIIAFGHRGKPRLERGRKPIGKIGVVHAPHVEAVERGLDPLALVAGHDNHRTRARRQRLLGGDAHQGPAADLGEQLVRTTHASRTAGGEDHCGDRPALLRLGFLARLRPRHDLHQQAADPVTGDVLTRHRQAGQQAHQHPVEAVLLG